MAEGMFITCVQKVLIIHRNNEPGELLPGSLDGGHFINKLTKVTQ